VAAIAEEEGSSMFRIMERADQYPAIARSAEKLKEFTALIRSFATDVLLPSALLPVVMEKTGYLAMLREMGQEGKADIDNLNELVSAAVEYESKNEEPSLVGFLEDAALVADVDKYDEDADAVVLMTIHSAKGLEFPVVFIAGAEEGTFPGMQSIREPAEMSEERRLAYVAITRAKEKLIVTHAEERLLYGNTQYRRPSRFFDAELPASLKDTGRPVAPPPKQSAFFRPKTDGLSREFSRPTAASVAPVYTKKSSALLAAGDRVRHVTFGEGEILSVRPMGGDALYEVRFASGTVKKLMATYAKLQKL
jgi:DNA helicase-2/ATP-dependent DNA helicase PcrA